MKLRSPILRKYFLNRQVCQLTQLFGENKNTLFYGSKGHTGLDYKTQGVYEYLYNTFQKYIRQTRDDKYKKGYIPIVAAHSGYLTVGYNDDKKEGVYMKIRDEHEKEYETMYFHLEYLRLWKDDEHLTAWEEMKGENYVRAGTIIGYGGNTGRFTTGAHLHFELRKNGYSIDPMPFFTEDLSDPNNEEITLYMRYSGIGDIRKWFFNGTEITERYAQDLQKRYS